MAKLLRRLSLALLLPPALLAALLLGANTDPGRRALEWAAARASGGQAVATGLGGTLPFAPRLAELTLRDRDGTWLVARDLALDLDPLGLTRGELRVVSVAAGSLDLIRLPIGEGESSGGLDLPLKVRVLHLGIPEIRLDRALPGAPPLAIVASGGLAGAGASHGRVLLTAPGRGDDYRLDGAVGDGHYRLDLRIRETPGGLLAALARSAGLALPPGLESGLTDWRLDAAVAGPADALSVAAILGAGPLGAAVSGTIDPEGGSIPGLRLWAELPAMALRGPDLARLELAPWDSGPAPPAGTDRAAPAGAPAGLPTVAWRRLALQAQLGGPWTRPRGAVRLDAQGLAAGGVGLDRLAARMEGDGGHAVLSAELRGPRLPRALPEPLAGAPLRLGADLAPMDPARPIRIALDHPLAGLAAQGSLATRSGHASLSLPDLAPLGTLAGLELGGRARLDLRGAADGPPRLDAAGELALTRAPGPLPALLGPLAGLAVSVQAQGDAWQIAQARLDGARLRAAAQGLASADALALGWTLGLPDLGALAPGWSGRAQARGGVSGRPQAPELVADLEASLDTGIALGARPAPSMAGRLAGRLQASLAAPAGTLDLRGDWAGQPVSVQLAGGRGADGGLHLSLGDSRFAGVALSGALALAPGAALPQGEIRLSAERLADLAPLIPGPGGAGIAGRLSASLTLDPGSARISAQGAGLVLPGPVGIEALTLDARVAEPLGSARTQATLDLRGLAVRSQSGSPPATGAATGPATGRAAGGPDPTIAGDLRLRADGALLGPAAALDLGTDLRVPAPFGPATLEAAGRLAAPARRLTLGRLEARARGQTLRLLAPAVLDLRDGIAVDRLRLGLGRGSLDLAGRLAPGLDLNATLTDLPLELVRLAAPDLPLAGTLGARIRLTGTPGAPLGSVSAEARGLRLTEGPGRALPPARIRIAADLGAAATGIDARAELPDRADLRLSGRILGRLPAAPEALALRADGRLDLALLDPLLTGGGRQASGQAALATDIAGTWAAPRLSGTLRLADAALRDRTIGLALTGIRGTLRLAGDSVVLEGVTGRTGGGTGGRTGGRSGARTSTGGGNRTADRPPAPGGPGTVALAGTVGLLAPGIPLDLRLTARNARPVQLDLIDIQGDADLRLAGRAAGRLDASGSTFLRRVEIRLPERLPASIPTLEVRERGGRARTEGATGRSPAAGLAPVVGLDLRLSAPRAVYVRGRGVDAELGGAVQVGGTLADPDLRGGFDLLRGEYDLAGQTLRISRGRIGFDGAAGLNPTLDLEARTVAAGGTAILAVLGTAREPRIELRGEPELPQDEVLSRLLFGVAGGRLSPVQAARLGLAAASLAGLDTGSGPGVLERVRRQFGLDRLAVDSDETGGAGLEGGRYISERVYLGARQGTRAGETQGVLRIEVTPRIRLEADVGATGGTRAGAAFEREY